MKNLTVGKKIVIGFTTFICLAILAGLFVVLRMNSVSKGAESLDSAYIPEVSIASELERSVLRTMIQSSGYIYTESNKYFEGIQDRSADVLNALDDARDLGERKQLALLVETEPKVRAAAAEYMELAEIAKSIVNTKALARRSMDENAVLMMNSAAEMLEGQERKLDFDVNDRVRKVSLVTSVIEQGDSARVSNFKAQALNDREYAENALSYLSGALNDLSDLREITILPDDIILIGEIEGAIGKYGDAINLYWGKIEEGSELSSEEIAAMKAKMDTSAGEFRRAASSFLDGQTEKLLVNINERVSKIKWMNSVIDLGNEARVNNFKAQTLRDTEFMKSALSLLSDMDDYYERLSGITRDAEDIALLSSTDKASKQYGAAIEKFMIAYEELRDVQKKMEHLAQFALAQSEALSARGMSETVSIAGNTTKQMSSASHIIIAGLIICVILGVVFTYYITRSITQPLLRAVEQLSVSARETGGASTQVSTASQSLAEGASEQAASLEETSSSMEEMTSMVARNAEVAMKTNEHAKEAREAAETGVQSMSELRDRADTVKASAVEMESAMQAIKESSDSISKIIKTIDEIAFQTNILALNAAVEAARAGEAGAGFAVVADEVRSLARRAADAAQETARMIEDSMERSERGVRVNETVGKSLGDVLDKAVQVEDGLKTISGIVTNVNDAMGELEASVREQQDGITQINTTVNQVNEVTQNNAASAEEAASAAEEMNAQSDNLLNIVDTLNQMVSQSGEGKEKGYRSNLPSLPVSQRESDGAALAFRGNGRLSKSIPEENKGSFRLPGELDN